MSTQSITRPPFKAYTKRPVIASARDKFRLSGSTIVIAGSVLSQFVDFTVGNIGGITISIQKIEAAFLLSMGFLLLGRIRARIEWWLVATIFLTAFMFALLLEGRLNEGLGAGITLLLSVVSAIILANAISVRNDRMRLFARMWTWACVITSIIAVGQAVGIIPTLVAHVIQPGAGALVRGRGLKYDPNFFAMLLVLGLVFSRFYISRVQRRYIWFILLMGLLATSSRMGIIVSAVVVVWAAGFPDNPPKRQFAAARAARTSLRLKRLLLLLAAGLVAFSFAPGDVQAYIQVRGGDLSAAYNGIVNGTDTMNANGINQTSGSARAELDRLTLSIFQRHWATGVGANQVPAYIEEEIGSALAGHNTYLETAAVGGVFGIAALILYLVSFRRLFKLAANNGAETSNLSCTMLIFASMASMGLVLTLDYNSILWLPLALIAGITQGATDPTAKNI